MEKEFVESSQIEAVGYEASTETMSVWFKNGSQYHYFGVNQEEYDTVKNADSIGKELNSSIKPYKDYAKIN